MNATEVMGGKKNKVCLSFAAIDKKYETTIPSFKESDTRGKDYVQYGEDNQVPEYLYGLYLSVSTLRTVIDGIDLVRECDAALAQQTEHTRDLRQG